MSRVHGRWCRAAASRGDVRHEGRLGGDWRPLRSCEPRPGAFLLIVYATGDLKPL